MMNKGIEIRRNNKPKEEKRMINPLGPHVSFNAANLCCKKPIMLTIIYLLRSLKDSFVSPILNMNLYIQK